MKIYKVGLLLVLVFCVLAASAQQKKNDGFVINGYIDGIEDGVNIRLIDIDGQRIIDSAKSINGTFTLNGKVKEPTACWLSCDDKFRNVMVENTTMTFSSSFKNMKLDAKVTGGREQQLHNRLIGLQLPFEKMYLEASDSLQNIPNLDKSVKAALIKKNNTNAENSHRIYVEFGKDNPDSYLGLDIIYRNRQIIGRDSIEILYNKLSTALKKTNKGEALRIFFSEALAQKGKPFIDFVANTINGEKFKLSSLEGKYILLCFGSAGCGYCRRQNQEISKSYDKFKDRISFVNFSVDINKEAWIDAANKDNITWTNVSDLEGTNGRIKTLYNVQSIPNSFLIDKNGIIIEIFDGYSPDFLNELEKKIN